MKLSMLPDSIVICSTKKSRGKRNMESSGLEKLVFTFCNKAVPHVTSEIKDGESLGKEPTLLTLLCYT